AGDQQRSPGTGWTRQDGTQPVEHVSILAPGGSGGRTRQGSVGDRSGGWASTRLAAGQLRGGSRPSQAGPALSQNDYRRDQGRTRIGPPEAEQTGRRQAGQADRG